VKLDGTIALQNERSPTDRLFAERCPLDHVTFGPRLDLEWFIERGTERRRLQEPLTRFRLLCNSLSGHKKVHECEYRLPQVHPDFPPVP